ncbi:MAG: hypothetical protein ACSLFR_13080 [Solirubrobacteraceae bacterium]
MSRRGARTSSHRPARAGPSSGYNGQPLYFYVNEGPGEVRCHNVFLNGGLWWVVGPNGTRRA